MPSAPKRQLHIAICDDESTDRRQVADLVGKVAGEEGLDCSIAAYESGAALLGDIQGGEQFHILLLDVMMDGLDGMELAAALRRREDSAAIVFISSNREMALRGYEVSAVRYLAKPVQQERLREALLYCYKTFCESKEILLPTEKGQSRISPADIRYIETWERGSRLWLADGPMETSARISELAAMLPERQFLFCHRTIFVNLAFIKHLRSREIELADGRTIPVSKYRFPAIRKKLLDYLHS